MYLYSFHPVGRYTFIILCISRQWLSWFYINRLWVFFCLLVKMLLFQKDGSHIIIDGVCVTFSFHPTGIFLLLSISEKWRQLSYRWMLLFACARMQTYIDPHINNVLSLNLAGYTRSGLTSFCFSSGLPRSQRFLFMFAYKQKPSFGDRLVRVSD